MKNEEEESPFFGGSKPKKRKLSWRLPAFVDKYNLIIFVSLQICMITLRILTAWNPNDLYF